MLPRRKRSDVISGDRTSRHHAVGGTCCSSLFPSLPSTSSKIVLVFIFVILASSSLSAKTTVEAFTPPVMGMGALLFPVQGLTIQGISSLDNGEPKKTAVRDAADFFVQAFWTAKVGGGSRKLTSRQEASLQQSQWAEFNKRYGSAGAGKNSPGRYGRAADLIVARNGAGEIVACAGVEVDRISLADSSSFGSASETDKIQAPLMSNLAVSRAYRRRGLAEQLVRAVEDVVSNDWGFTSCYLYVEERNRPAVKLYQKLGYRKIWRNGDAKTLMPTTDGGLVTTGTILVCMEKQLSNKKKRGWFGF